MSGYLVLLPLLSIYLFHAPGIPGLLQHGGVAWLLAWGLARLTAWRRVD